MCTRCPVLWSTMPPDACATCSAVAPGSPLEDRAVVVGRPPMDHPPPFVGEHEDDASARGTAFSSRDPRAAWPPAPARTRRRPRRSTALPGLGRPVQRSPLDRTNAGAVLESPKHPVLAVPAHRRAPSSGFRSTSMSPRNSGETTPSCTVGGPRFAKVSQNNPRRLGFSRVRRRQAARRRRTRSRDAPGGLRSQDRPRRRTTTPDGPAKESAWATPRSH